MGHLHLVGPTPVQGYRGKPHAWHLFRFSISWSRAELSSECEIGPPDLSLVTSNICNLKQDDATEKQGNLKKKSDKPTVNLSCSRNDIPSPPPTYMQSSQRKKYKDKVANSASLLHSLSQFEGFAKLIRFSPAFFNHIKTCHSPGHTFSNSDYKLGRGTKMLSVVLTPTACAAKASAC